jgi:hypothetical protein
VIHPAGDITIEAIFFKISNLLVEWSGQLIFLGSTSSTVKVSLPLWYHNATSQYISLGGIWIPAYAGMTSFVLCWRMPTLFQAWNG